jgi:hypothetical protein
MTQLSAAPQCINEPMQDAFVLLPARRGESTLLEVMMKKHLEDRILRIDRYQGIADTFVQLFPTYASAVMEPAARSETRAAISEGEIES